ncbi:uncharacterized protein LOC135078625 isoform X1 [Ostrinia nubilalis]|uniref:uncharacterized protein LOC135078625 isoform X1 n=1 Tax=Ostrinia nubilalis TaxID=29057 RepID=UPI0030823AB4
MASSESSILRISDQKTLELVELYKKEECLWDTTSLSHRIKCRRRQAAEKIARILNIPNFDASHVMIKLKNLRNAYCQELKKSAMLQNQGVGDDAPKKTKPKPQWYAVMDTFIRPHLKANYTPSGPTLVINGGIIKREPEPEPLDDPDELWDNPGSEEERLSELPKTTDTCVDSIDFDYEQYKRPAPSTSSNSPKRMRSESLLAESLKEVSTNLAGLKEDAAKNQHMTKEELHDNFGRYVASLMRLLPMKKALMLQPKIVNMISSEIIDCQDDIFD